MIATIISIIIASLATTLSSFDGNYNEISYGNTNYSPSAPALQENKYVNLTDDFLKEFREIKEGINLLKIKYDTAPQESLILQTMLKNPIPGNQTFNATLWRASILLQLQYTLKSKNSLLIKTLNEDELYLKNYLHQRHSLFSLNNPFTSSLLTVSIFGIIPCIVGCIFLNKMHLITASVFCNTGFFAYLWTKRSISLNKRQKKFTNVAWPEFIQQKNSNIIEFNQFVQKTCADLEEEAQMIKDASMALEGKPLDSSN